MDVLYLIVSEDKSNCYAVNLLISDVDSHIHDQDLMEDLGWRKEDSDSNKISQHEIQQGRPEYSAVKDIIVILIKGESSLTFHEIFLLHHRHH